MGSSSCDKRKNLNNSFWNSKPTYYFGEKKITMVLQFHALDKELLDLKDVIIKVPQINNSI